MIFSQHAITIIILATLISAYGINMMAEAMNIRNLKQPLPEDFKDHFDDIRYLKSQNYLKATTKFGFIVSTTDLALLLIFWFLGGFQYVDDFVRSFHLGSVVSGLIFTAILLMLKLIISLPFTLYSTFVIEEQFGFNKTTVLLFIIDMIKSVLLSAVLGGLLLSLVLVFLESGGPWAWVMCWAGSTVFMLAVQYIVPTWIMPLFNKFTPLEEGPLKTAIMAYADSIDFSLSNIFVMDGSKRSSRSNAFFTGFGKNKRIVLFDTLIKEQTTQELVSVLAHEMGHFKKRHIIKRMIWGIFQMGFIFFLISLFISHEPLFHAFFLKEASIYAGLIFFMMLYSPIDLFVSIILQIFSRKDEYEADCFAAKTIKTSEPLINALKKLSAHNLSNLTPHPFYVFLNYSHPPVLERIKRLRAI
ncbi:MAG: M48 family metallopeptidase [Pseudomonadota bacterium]